MGYEHFFTAPDGTELVVITRAELEQLRISDRDADEDAADIASANRALAESDVRYPAAVVDAMLAGDAPIAAWRKHRGLSQAALAKKAGITQAAVSRLETGDGNAFGRVDTRTAIAKALDVTQAALLPLDS